VVWHRPSTDSYFQSPRGHPGSRPPQKNIFHDYDAYSASENGMDRPCSPPNSATVTVFGVAGIDGPLRLRRSRATRRLRHRRSIPVARLSQPAKVATANKLKAKNGNSRRTPCALISVPQMLWYGQAAACPRAAHKTADLPKSPFTHRQC
jgi:hypothetical protein